MKIFSQSASRGKGVQLLPSLKSKRKFRKNFGPRGVLHCWADGKGGQKIENTGSLTKKRMETIDDEIVAGAKDFIKRAHKDGKPFFVWANTTHMLFALMPSRRAWASRGDGNRNITTPCGGARIRVAIDRGLRWST